MWFWYVYTKLQAIFGSSRWRLVGRSTERALHHDAHNCVLYSSCADGLRAVSGATLQRRPNGNAKPGARRPRTGPRLSHASSCIGAWCARDSALER